MMGPYGIMYDFSNNHGSSLTMVLQLLVFLGHLGTRLLNYYCTGYLGTIAAINATVFL